jgi:microsomal epoxide hydrolase/non-specific protein-tyrosine kinase
MHPFLGTPLRAAELPGLCIAYRTFGSLGSRCPIVLCHGFPETSFSWRYQVGALARSGHFVIVPDLRGYGATGGPDAVEAYDMETICDDIVGLLGKVGSSRAIIAGHDWGGALAWNMAMRRPRHVAGVISLCTPFHARSPADPIAIMRRRFGEDMYMVHFQKQGEPDAILDRSPRKTLDYFFRRPSADMNNRGTGISTVPGAGTSILPIVREIEAYDPGCDGREHFLSRPEFDHFVSAFEATGFTRAINWYRNITRNWETAASYDGIVQQPALLLQAEHDRFLPPAAAEGMECIVPRLERQLVRRAGHWLQQENPNEVTLAMIAWIERHFPE